MNNPVYSFNPASFLQIEGDPTVWGLKTLQAQDPGWDGDPVAIAIGWPVDGTLILSPTRMGSCVLTYNDERNGWHPATLPSGSLYLYIPTTDGLTVSPKNRPESGYTLTAQQNLNDLQRKIIDTMSGEGSILTLHTDAVGGGVVILSGAQLPFAVIAEGSLVPPPLR